MDFKDIKWFFQCWGKYETMFPTIGFLDYQILNIIGSQIETKIIFCLVGILTNWKRYHLQLDNF
jgi:hypothetical protein